MTVAAYISRALAFGVGHLRLPPRDVWAMSLVEYDAAQRGYAASRGIDRRRGMGRKRLAELMALYPDTPKADTA